ncbi:carboxypeptidase regulatory-like domain-containing protein [Archangium violaceum]|uniref:MSCRAMM family protein n=1 Tax=Archangium violaceum TaxID=83451 RepID=UPI00194EF2B3|nr:carboxypeptidase regulatory-like domain-containing protein [Archangium violaceum]QRO00930.1 carboxypeptidase regulatory-like domain-containing protein [Archangium violaceum]
MRRWLGIGVALAVLAAVLGYASGTWTDRPASDLTEEETGRHEGARDTARHQRPVNALLEAPLPAPRGSLHIRGTVVGPQGEPVPGAVVVATSPTPDEALSELPCQCDNHCEQKLLQCGCGMAASQQAELVTVRRGEAPPLARTTSDARGHFSLEGLETGRYALWTESPFGTALRQDVGTGTEDVELRVGQGMTLSGHLTDEEGRPVPGTLVTAIFVEHSRFFDTLSDAEGRWRLGPLPEGEYNLVFAKEGFLHEHAMVRELSEREQPVTLLRPLRLAGQVTRGGKPVPGARVRAEGEHRKLDTPTNEQGRFSFEGLRPGWYEVGATFSGLDAAGQALLQPGVDDSELVLELGAGARVMGTVRDTSGRPISGARISMQSLVAEYGHPWRKTRTTSEGTYELGPIEPGKYHFRVEAPRYLNPPPVVKYVEGPTSQDFVLEEAAVVEGRVVGPRGEPLENVTLLLKDLGDEEVVRSSSEKDGTFALAAPKPGNYQLQADHGDFTPITRPVSAPSTGVQVVLSTGAEVVGAVVDETGAPVSRATVSIAPPEPEAGSRPERQTTTDEQGHFTLEGLLPGKYVLSARDTPSAEMRKVSRPVELVGTQSLQVRLQLPAGLPLAGIVVDGEGRPVPEARIRAYRLMEPGEEERAYYANGAEGPYTGADGRFQLRHLETRRYEVSAVKDGYVFDAKASGSTSSETGSSNDGIEVRAGATNLRLVLQQRGTIRGRVVRTDGTPVTRFQLNGVQMTHPQGIFTWPIDQSGTAKLDFTAPRLVGTTRELQVKEGEDTTLGEVVLETGRTLRGKVVDAATGGPVSGAMVGVSDTPVDTRELGSLREGDGAARTQGDGSFTLSGVEERPLTLTVVHPAYIQKRMALDSQRTEVTVSLDKGAILRGRVNLAEKRLYGIGIRSLDGSFEKHEPVAESAYEFRGLPAGSYIVRLNGRHIDRARTIHPQRVEIPTQGVVTLDFEEARAGTTLRLRLLGVDMKPYSFGLLLVDGSVPAPDSPEALQRMVVSAYWPSSSDEPGLFHFPFIPPGTYTLLLVRKTDQDVALHHEVLELPDPGEVSRDVTPRWERRPSRQLFGDRRP